MAASASLTTDLGPPAELRLSGSRRPRKRERVQGNGTRLISLPPEVELETAGSALGVG